MAPNHTTWGGNILQDKVSKKYHMYVSSMTNGCGLGHWRTNSRIEHAVSDTITGPYTFQDVAVNTQAHNAAPIALPDGTFAIVHIGPGNRGPKGGANCSNQISSEDYFPLDEGDLNSPPGSGIHVSDSLDGPWSPLLSDSLPKVRTITTIN